MREPCRSIRRPRMCFKIPACGDRFSLADAGNIYGRLTNSTQEVFEKRIAALEGGIAGLAVASGAAAITYTIQALASAGEHIVAQKTIYGEPRSVGKYSAIVWNYGNIC